MTLKVVETTGRKKLYRRKSSKTASGQKKKDRTMTSLKKEADRHFSLFLRQKYMDDEGNIKCYTCPTVRPLKKMQCGHFVSRKYIPTRYDERNCRPQCWYCNGHGYGNGRPVEFSQGLRKEYGEDIVKDLYELAAQDARDFDYQAIIDKYKVVDKKD